jgi:hypothetical protein
MATTNLTKITVGREITPGTPVARTHVIPVGDVSTLDRKIDGITDPLFIGRNLASQRYAVGGNTGGDIPVLVRPAGGQALLVKSLLGVEKPVTQVSACISIKYAGIEESCKLVTDNAANTLTSSIGSLGSEVADSNFGTTGVLSFADPASDTLLEVVTVIDGYADYSCTKIFGDDALLLTTDKVKDAIITQGKNKEAFIWFTSTTSGAYLHEFEYDITATELPTLSIQKDGYGPGATDNYLFTGCVVDGMDMTGAIKQIITGTANILGFGEAGGQTASALEMPQIDPLIFTNGTTNIEGVSFTYISNWSLSFQNGHTPDGYGQGSIDRTYHQKGSTSITGSFSIKMDDQSHELRDYVEPGTQIPMSLVFKANRYISANIPQLMIVQMPYLSVTDYDFGNAGGIFTTEITYECFYPKGTIWDNPFTISMLTTDSSAY